MAGKNRGNYQEWGVVWGDESKTNHVNPHFTLRPSETINQLWQKAYATDLLNLIEGKEYTDFCEFGSGRGTTTMYLANAGITNLTMVDLSDQGFEIAKHSFEYWNMDLPNMVLADVEESGLPDESFDCIYNIGLLEHFEDPSKTLKESYRILRKNGMIFMPIVPSLPWYKSIIQRMLFSQISLLKILIKKFWG